jgi:hypothetical protein
MNIGSISYGFQISTEKRRGTISCVVPLMFSAWRKDVYQANWRYRAGGDGILLPEPRAGACRRELRVGIDHRSCRHTRPCSEHERQRPGLTNANRSRRPTRSREGVYVTVKRRQCSDVYVSASASRRMPSRISRSHRGAYPRTTPVRLGGFI